MSFNIKMEKEYLGSVLPDHALSFIKGISAPISEPMSKVVLSVMGGEDVFEKFASEYAGSNQLIHDLVVAYNVSGSESVLARVLEIVRCVLIGNVDALGYPIPTVKLPLDAPVESVTPPMFEVVASAMAETTSDGDVTIVPTARVAGWLPKTSDSRENRDYRCFKAGCEYIADGITALYVHGLLGNEKHKSWPHAATKLRMLGHSNESIAALGVPGVAPDTGSRPVDTLALSALEVPPAPEYRPFEPKYGLNIEVLPDARYCVEDPLNPGSFAYVRKYTVKRRYQRSGAFQWGFTHRFTRHWVQPGTIEVRSQSGDTKKLFGESRSGIYYGDNEEVMKAILDNPVEAMLRYGERMKCCSYCGRSLTDPISQERHIGPECWDSKHVPFIERQVKAILAGAGVES
jgi:hypothetical protein